MLSFHGTVELMLGTVPDLQAGVVGTAVLSPGPRGWQIAVAFPYVGNGMFTADVQEQPAKEASRTITETHADEGGWSTAAAMLWCHQSVWMDVGAHGGHGSGVQSLLPSADRAAALCSGQTRSITGPMRLPALRPPLLEATLQRRRVQDNQGTSGRHGCNSLHARDAGT